jgi:hypothetical protein
LDKCGVLLWFFEGKGDYPPCVRRNEGKFDFLALVVKFGFEGEVATAFCKMRWLVGEMTETQNLKNLKILIFFITSIARKRQI